MSSCFSYYHHPDTQLHWHPPDILMCFMRGVSFLPEVSEITGRINKAWPDGKSCRNWKDYASIQWSAVNATPHTNEIQIMRINLGSLLGLGACFNVLVSGSSHQYFISDMRVSWGLGSDMVWDDIVGRTSILPLQGCTQLNVTDSNQFFNF